MTSDLDALNDLYNHYVLSTPIAFDIEPVGMNSRHEWFTHYAERGRHRLIVAVDGGRLVGYTTSSPWRLERAYETSVETSISIAPDAIARGIGSQLYTALFGALASEDVHRAYAGITQPNPASVALHVASGSRWSAPSRSRAASLAATEMWPGTRSRWDKPSRTVPRRLLLLLGD